MKLTTVRNWNYESEWNGVQWLDPGEIKILPVAILGDRRDRIGSVGRAGFQGWDFTVRFNGRQIDRLKSNVRDIG